MYCIPTITIEFCVATASFTSFKTASFFSVVFVESQLPNLDRGLSLKLSPLAFASLYSLFEDALRLACTCEPFALLLLVKIIVLVVLCVMVFETYYNQVYITCTIYQFSSIFF